MTDRVSPQRHRYATRAELARLLATPDTTESDFDAVLDALADSGVYVDQLVKITTDEQNIPISVVLPVNTCETDADAARRFAGELQRKDQLLNAQIAVTDAAMRLLAEGIRVTEHLADRAEVQAWRQTAARFPEPTQ